MQDHNLDFDPDEPRSLFKSFRTMEGLQVAGPSPFPSEVLYPVSPEFPGKILPPPRAKPHNLHSTPQPSGKHRRRRQRRTDAK
jgi:hypothetical protein